MSKKRRDNKRRILRNGESQRSDGRYAYKYMGKDGKPHFVYSWKLEKTDSLPSGKRECEALREQEKKIIKELETVANETQVSNLTIVGLVNRYMETSSLRPQTVVSYSSAMKALSHSSLGNKKVLQVTVMDVKNYAIELSKSHSYNTVAMYIAPIRAAFTDSMDSGELTYNPCAFKLYKVVPKDAAHREAISEQNVNALLDFCRTDKMSQKNLYPLTILFGTGMRISEMAGLTFADVDLSKKIIYVRHQLAYVNKTFVLSEPKTTAGTRIIPMSEAVVEAFENVFSERKPPKNEQFKDFIFLSQVGAPILGINWRKRFATCIKRMADKTGSTELISFTPHLCRHTFCSNMVIKGMNLKALQAVMGHSSMHMTTDRYAHISNQDDIIDAFTKVTK